MVRTPACDELSRAGQARSVWLSGLSGPSGESHATKQTRQTEQTKGTRQLADFFSILLLNARLAL
jgi:hypothetical protein